MFNLKFSTDNNSLERIGMIVTRNDWTINGKVIEAREVKNGFWIRVKTSVKISDLYNFDKLEFDCYLSKEVAKTAYKKNSYLHKLHAVGKFIFDKKNNYFIVQRMLV